MNWIYFHFYSILGDCKASKPQVCGLDSKKSTLEGRMERLSEVYDLDSQFFSNHNVALLDVKMNNVVSFEISESLWNHEGKVYDGMLRKGQIEFFHIIFQT